MVTAFFPKFRLAALFAGALAMLALVTVFTPQAEAKKKRSSGTAVLVPLSGTVQGDPQSSFKGWFLNPKAEKDDQGNVSLTGTVVGTVTNSDGTTKNVNEPAKVPVTGLTTQGATSSEGDVSTQATCNILNLVLGPLHLNLLGLVIDLNQVVLNITGVTGSGNLLGNLLCAIAGLLDSTGTPLGNVSNIAQILNQLLALLFTRSL